MDEVYTCICKNQTWEIHDTFVKCTNTKCKRKYQMNQSGTVSYLSPKKFNDRAEALAAIKGIYPTGTARGA